MAGKPPSYAPPVHQDAGPYYSGAGQSTPSPAPYIQSPPPAAGPDGTPYNNHHGYYGGDQQIQPYPQYGSPGPYGGPPPQQSGYYPPIYGPGYPPPQQQGMYYQQGPPQGYFDDRQRGPGGFGGEGICAGLIAAMACCCCMDALFWL